MKGVKEHLFKSILDLWALRDLDYAGRAVWIHFTQAVYQTPTNKLQNESKNDRI